MNNTFQKLNQDWFEILFEKYNIEMNDYRIDSQISVPIDIDLSKISFTSFFDLLNLFLTIDYCQDFIGNVIINFYGLGSYSKVKIMPIDEYNIIRSSDESDFKKNLSYQNSKKTYNFLSYLHHFGLFNSLSLARSSGRVTLSGISDNLLNKLFAYSGIGTKIMNLTPFFNKSLTNELRLESSIDIWLRSLPDKFLRHPIFRDGEFSRVLGYQLAYNAIEHSNFKSRNGTGSLGTLCMQLIEKEKFWNHKEYYPRDFQKIFNEENDGVMELCIGDKGVGIYTTLKDYYLDLYNKIGEYKKDELTEEELIKEVISFAFDEIGSSKKGNKRIGGVHALHRILKVTAKYGGVLRIRSNGFEFIYNLSTNELKRNVKGLGFSANKINKVIHPFGVQFQILIPLKVDSKSTKVLPPRTYVQNKKLGKKLIIPLAAYFDKEKDYNSLDLVINQISFVTTTNELFEEPEDTLIVYDFGNRSWTEEEIALILLSQKGILHTKFCIGINLPKGLPKILRDREKMKVDISKKKITSDTDFFDVLSSKHRLFPVFDTTDELSWLGLSEYQFDEILTISYNTSDNSLTEDHIFYKGISEEEKEICKIYLKNNNHIFNELYKGREWKSKITNNLYQDICKTLIRKNFPQILKDLGCVLQRKNEKYILPTSKIISDKFIQVTPSFQEQSSALQLAKWFANAILQKLNSNEEKILLVTTNAPSELMGKTIADALYPKKIFLLNLSLYSKNYELLESTTEWKNIPLFIINDIFDPWKSIDEKELIIDKGLKIDGILSLIKYNTKLKNEIEVTASWKELKFVKEGNEIKIPHFIFGEIKQPKKHEWKNLSETNKKKLRLIETFSTHDFKLENLAFVEKENIRKLKFLESENLLREGHWVYEQHHFSVTICLKKLFSNTIISGQISQHIIKTIRENKINTILIPLHSHIKDFIQSLLLNIKLHLGFSIDYYYCVSTKGLTENPFYIIPRKVEKELEQGMKLYRVLLIDDAIATGRTQETLLRALIRAASKNKEKKPRLEQVHIFTVINRMGKAKSTFLGAIMNIGLKNNSYPIKFSFRAWISLDMPVYDRESCPICHERSKLTYLQESLSSLGDISILQEVKNKLKRLIPHSTESPTFINSERQTLLPNNKKVTIGKIEAETVELAIW
ncbi:MAG: hypothetical protein KAT68_10325 [Bacteroidales bacterium]|nr:hypothetical protein [Bacteroidales bacterium]